MLKLKSDVFDKPKFTDQNLPKFLTAEKQKTIAGNIEVKGIGLHTGNKTSMRLNPAPINTGYVFRLKKSGKIYLNGVDCSNFPIHERSSRFNLSYCPQYGGYFYDLTVLENLTSVAEIHIKEKNLRISKIDKIIAQFGFDSILNVKAKLVSGGERRKLAIGMAIIL